MLEVITLILSSSLLLLILHYKWCFQYWERLGIYSIPATIPFGNTQNPATRKYPFYILMSKHYKHFKEQNVKHGGLYIMSQPRYVPIDPAFVRNVLTKDFTHFVDRSFYFNEKDDPLSAHLFSIEGEKWRTLRAKMTPTFTSGKMRNMLQTMIDCSAPMKQCLEEKCGSGKAAINIKEIGACYTTDVIGSVAFGLECNSFKNPDASFRCYGKKALNFPITSVAKFYLCFTHPKLSRFLGLCTTPKDVSNFFQEAVKTTIDYRRKNDVRRNDFMQILLDLKLDDGTKALTFHEIAAQAFVFFLGGFETTSSTMQFCLYELSKNQEVQSRVRREINQILAKHKNELTYDAIQDMKYLNQVLEETLRMYPPLPVLTRNCTKRYEVPGTNLVLEENTRVFVPLLALQTDPDYFPNPKTFDPDRFSEENRERIVPFTYFPFGEGPRICIGKRFGLFQVKVGLITVLRNFMVTLGQNTPTKLQFDPNSFIMNVKGEMYLDFQSIKLA